MQSLYRNGLEKLYDAIYQTFIDYDDEYQFYNSILSKYNLNSVLEIGCGTGNLAKLFIENNMDYKGLDLSADMITLSKKKNPGGTFIESDMARFHLEDNIDSAIITGRTSSYLIENKILSESLQNIHRNLKEGGLLIFDFIDAERFFKIIGKGKDVTHSCSYDGVEYYRDSLFKVDLILENFMFNWRAKYFKIQDKEKILLTEDDSTVRAFTREEWKLLLNLNGFEVLEVIDRKSYAFDTYVIVAKKSQT
ncbi:Methyltransferase domain-containing protein [Flavobacteriaceae bacterium MAR_2010_188]|nr:Methyltransferase domain-containing protein [Flavobacteriaceae bacterium MAR_2010_188]